MWAAAPPTLRAAALGWQRFFMNRHTTVPGKGNRMEQLMKDLGYTFQNEALLMRALTHPSVGGKEDNQRLEFLGDAVLQYCMSRILYDKHPDQNEGGLTHRRAQLVCEAALAKVAQMVHLDRHLLLNKSQEQDGGRENPSILADAMEAVLAAVCLDGGIQESLNLIKRLWPPEESFKVTVQDHKSTLQELVQAKGQPAPVYEIIDTEGPPHARTFTAQVVIAGLSPCQGKGKTKRQAEQAAAEKALGAFQK